MALDDIIRRAVKGTGPVSLTPTPPGGAAMDPFTATSRDSKLEDFGERPRNSRARYFLTAAVDLPDGIARNWTVSDGTDTFKVMAVDRSVDGLARIDVTV